MDYDDLHHKVCNICGLTEYFNVFEKYVPMSV